MNARVQALIDRLHLSPHPEGGFYRQTYRSASVVRPADDRPARQSLTTIYFLLDSTQHSRWHRVRSDEAWHFYEGDPAELLLLDPAGQAVVAVRLGPVGAGASEPVHVVPAGWWQAARPTARTASSAALWRPASSSRTLISSGRTTPLSIASRDCGRIW